MTRNSPAAEPASGGSSVAGGPCWRQGHGRREHPGLLWWPVLGTHGVHGLSMGVVMLPGASELLSWTNSDAFRSILASQSASRLLVARDQQDELL